MGLNIESPRTAPHPPGPIGLSPGSSASTAFIESMAWEPPQAGLGAAGNLCGPSWPRPLPPQQWHLTPPSPTAVPGNLKGLNTSVLSGGMEIQVADTAGGVVRTTVTASEANLPTPTWVCTDPREECTPRTPAGTASFWNG